MHRSRALTDSTLNRRRLIKMGNLPAIAHDSNPRCDAIFSFSLLRVRFYLHFSTLFRPFSSLRIVHPKRQERTVLRFHSSGFS